MRRQQPPHAVHRQDDIFTEILLPAQYPSIFSASTSTVLSVPPP
jgi:hypothetical protein